METHTRAESKVVGAQTSGAASPPENAVSVDLRGRPSDLSRTGAWKAAPYIYGLVGGDILVGFGLIGNLMVFFVGSLNFPISEAANIITNFVGTSFAVTLVWGFLADSYLGHFWTASSGGFLQIIGAVTMAVTVARKNLFPPTCALSALLTGACVEASSKFMSPFTAGLYLVAVGSGGVKACVSAFGAEQFDDSIPAEKKQKPRFFNFLYLSLQLGTLAAVTLITYLLTVSHVAGFTTLAAISISALLFFALGGKFYRNKIPSGSALTRLAQVIVVIIRNRNLSLPASVDQLYEVPVGKVPGHQRLIIQHTNRLRIFDKAAILANGDVVDNPWRVCTVTQVEEFKRIVLMIPIWLTGCIVYTLFAQFASFSVQQASSMNRQIGEFNVPPASIGVFALVAVITLVPFYDGVFVPIARKLTRHPQGITTLQRIGMGILFSILAMITAAMVERKRVHAATEAVKELLQKTHRPPGPDFVIPLSAYWLVPQYFLIGMTELFTIVGHLEFYYDEAPAGLKSLGVSFYFTSFAVGNFLSTALVTLTNKVTRNGGKGSWLENPFLNQGGLTRFYFLLAIIVVVDLCFFLLSAHFYKYKSLHEEFVEGEVDLPSNESLITTGDKV